jgi:hypothetical protein
MLEEALPFHPSAVKTNTVYCTATYDSLYKVKGPHTPKAKVMLDDPRL